MKLLLKIQENSIKLTKKQFSQILDLSEYFIKYKKIEELEYQKRKYIWLRPRGTLGQALKKKRSKDWWQYFYKATMNLEKDRKGVFHARSMPEGQLKSYSEIFKKFFGKHFKEFPWWKWHEDDIQLYKVVLLSLDDEVLKKLIGEIVADGLRTEKEEKLKKKDAGWFGGVASWFAEEKKSAESPITESDIREIDD